MDRVRHGRQRGRRPACGGPRAAGALLRALCTLLPSLLGQSAAWADEGGVGFWLPGNFGSLAAAPSEPGLTLPLVYFHSFGDAGASAPFFRGSRITAGVEARSDLLFLSPTFVFAAPVAGGQASVGIGGAFGRVRVGVDATLTGPNGDALSGSERDERTGLSDLYPTAALRWNRGVHSFLAYTMAGVPVGTYDAQRLASLGINHWALDGGGGYTYFDKRHELSAALGLTYNFENPDTDYRNGVDAHLDLGASEFLSEHLHAGLVGYVYHQLSGDSGAGATLGDFKSQVLGIGPQVGAFFELGGRTWYANLKGYYEFAARNRPEGWNATLTLAIPFGPASH